MTLRTTHTYALLEVSKAAWDEIASKLREAGYKHAFGDDGEIDMHGIALVKQEPAAAPLVGDNRMELPLSDPSLRPPRGRLFMAENGKQKEVTHIVDDVGSGP